MSDEYTAKSAAVQDPSLSDCVSGPVQGSDHFQGFSGMWLSCTPNKTHTFRVLTDPGHACVNFTAEDSHFVAWIHPPYYPERSYHFTNNRVFVYVGLKGACGFPPFGYAPLRACKTAYGWFVEIDSTNTGNYDMTVGFYD